jgi:hypothetical protein
MLYYNKFKQREHIIRRNYLVANKMGLLHAKHSSGLAARMGGP